MSDVRSPRSGTREWHIGLAEDMTMYCRTRDTSHKYRHRSAFSRCSCGMRSFHISPLYTADKAHVIRRLYTNLSHHPNMSVSYHPLTPPFLCIWGIVFSSRADLVKISARRVGIPKHRSLRVGYTLPSFSHTPTGTAGKGTTRCILKRLSQGFIH